MATADSACELLRGIAARRRGGDDRAGEPFCLTVGFLLPLKILVAFLQAFIFVMLSMLYIAGATEDAEHH